MKKLTPFLLSGILLFGAVACNNAAKTTSDAPNSTENVGQPPDSSSVQNTQKDASSQTREAQRASDERARADRSNATGGSAPTSDGDLESKVRNELERELPSSKLAVDAKDGVVTVSGTVTSQDQLPKISSAAKKVQGVKSVNVKATVAQPKS